MNESSAGPKRIAILGGGVASLATAYELSSLPDFARKYELTVYQQGHRLGGKAASSRARPSPGVERIEEHGLHMFFGFYENAFDLMRRAYQDLAQLPYAPGETYRFDLAHAFLPHDLIMLGSTYKGRVRSWALPFPRRDGAPGVAGDTRGDRNATFVDGGTILAGLLEIMVAQLLNVADIEVDGLGPSETGRGDLERELAGIRRKGKDGEDIVTDILLAVMSVRRLLQGRIAPRALVTGLRTLQAMLGAFGRHPVLRHKAVRSTLASILSAIREQALTFLEELVADEFRIHQLRVSLDMFFTLAIGLLREDMLHRDADWFALDDVDYRTWMQRHGARAETICSAPLLTLADATFSDPKSAGAGAGTTLHLTLRMLLTYKDAIVFRLGGGMGETVVAPLYRVLEGRGVKFKFFHRLEQLVPGQRDGRPVVEAVEFRRQARVKAGDDKYRALEAFGDGMLCFPAQADFAQLVEGDELRRRGIDLEDSWNAWDKDRPLESLRLGRDFDALVLGVSIGGLPALCGELASYADAQPALRRGKLGLTPRLSAMLRNVRSIETMAAQLWFKPSFPQLQGPSAAGVGVEYAQPFDTWSEMNHLLPRERWPEGKEPGSLVYLCSAVDEPVGYAPPPFFDHGHTARRREEIKHVVRRWLDLHGARIFSGAESHGQLDYGLLTDPRERTGSARFEAQYWCATNNPSDRYVLSAPGSNRHRLRPHESGYDNLVMTGDWTLTSISAGCVEGTVMSGKDAARALTGLPGQIVGDWLTRVHPELLCEPILPRLPQYAPPAIESALAPVATPPTPTSNDNAPSQRPPASAPHDDPGATGVHMVSSSLKLPRYLKRPFDVQTAPPAMCEDARTDWFFFAADEARLSELVNELNHPESPTIFEPLLPVVAFVAAQVARISGGNDRCGYLPERDFAFWIPVKASARPGREAAHTASPIAWYQPCLWVDSCPAVVGGRETFGMNKVLGHLNVPRPAQPAFSIDTMAIERFGPESQASIQRVLELTVADEPGLLARLSRLTELLVQESLGALLQSQVGVAAELLEPLVAQLDKSSLPIVSLKQFPDAERPELACYKVVVETPSRAVGALALWPWPGAHRLRLFPMDSHPISRLLGLHVGLTHEAGSPVETAAPFFALSAELSFVLEPGRVLFDFVAAEKALLDFAEVG